MKAIILSAGQGSRLLPLTEDCPKCLLTIGAKSLLERQIDALYACGVRDICVVVGFLAGAVEHHLQDITKPDLTIYSVFNPFYDVSDNLASCWMARHEMNQDFMLLNGDTLFDSEIVMRLLNGPLQAVTLTIDRKTEYDSDDMKICLDGDRLIDVDKSIESSRIDGESIGITLFRGAGPSQFCEILEQEIRKPIGIKRYYLQAINILAARTHVGVQSIEGLKWAEVDFPQDLELARELFASPEARREKIIGL